MGLAGSPRFDGSREIQEVQVAGEWAFMWSELAVAVTPPAGPPMKLAGPVLSVLRRERGKWVLARDANMLTPVS
jgi:ketosteroid isomerase-like protein